jgi:hypothetical protein
MEQTVGRLVQARNLRSGDKTFINREPMTVKYVSSRQARADRRALSMMTRGRDLEDVISVDFINSQGRLVSREFDALQTLSVQ